MSKVEPGTADSAYPPPPDPVYAQYNPHGHQQPAYGAPAHGTTIVVSQPVMGGPMPGSGCHYHEAPCLVVCQHCHSTVTTTTSYSVGTFTWLACFGLIIIGCSLGCCLIPCCVNGCKDVVHTCPNCHQVVGRFNRM